MNYNFIYIFHYNFDLKYRLILNCLKTINNIQLFKKYILNKIKKETKKYVDKKWKEILTCQYFLL